MQVRETKAPVPSARRLVAAAILMCATATASGAQVADKRVLMYLERLDGTFAAGTHLVGKARK
jgi:hypothetical protein